MISAVLGRLKRDFGLRDNHILIIQFLNEKEMTADEICRATGIPKGRVYDFLNYLRNSGLIEKSGRTPATYRIGNLRQNILNFLRFRFDDLVGKEKGIMSVLEAEEEPEHVMVVNNRDQYITGLRKSLANDSVFKINMRDNAVPYFFYPRDEKSFMKLRRAISRKRSTVSGADQTTSLFHKSYWEAFEAGKGFQYTINHSSLKFYKEVVLEELGEKAWKALVRQVRAYLKKYSIKINIIRGHFPYFMFLSDRRLFLALISEGMVRGLFIISSKAVESYSKLFDKSFGKGKPIQNYLDKL